MTVKKYVCKVCGKTLRVDENGKFVHVLKMSAKEFHLAVLK